MSVGRSALSYIAYSFLVIAAGCAVALSCVFLLTQAVRASPRHSLKYNYDALIIGASYVVVLLLSAFFCLKRRISVAMALQRISRSHKMIGKNDVPKTVHDYIRQEYHRSSLIAYESLPRDVFHEGWGKPGIQLENINFRRSLLDSIYQVDETARLVIPSLPHLKHNVRIIRHFRYLLPLLPMDGDGLSPLHYYDSAIQLARTSSREPTEQEYLVGEAAKEQIIAVLGECLEEMSISSGTATHI